MICRMCHGPATPRDDYAFGALCDKCSPTYMSWPCPNCAEVRHGIREHVGEPCRHCEILRLWNPLPAAVQEEIDRVIAELENIMAIKRIRELAGGGRREAGGGRREAGGGRREAIMLHGDRWSAVRDS